MSADTTSVRYALRLQEAARGAGLDGQALCAEAGLSLPLRSEPELRVPTALVHRLLGLLAQRTGDPAFALRLAATGRVETFDVIAFAAMTCPTLGEGLRCACRYLSLFIDSALWVLHDNEPARLEFIRMAAPRPEHLLAEDLAVGDMVGFIRRALGRRWSPLSVWLQRPAPLDRRLYREHFGEGVKFGQAASSILFAPRELELPMPKGDPALAAFFRQHAEIQLAKRHTLASLSAQVERAIAARVGGELPSVDEVAALLGQSPRTLRRKLEEESTSFRALLDDARRIFAEGHLAEGRLAIKEIGFLLGFAEVSAFSRAFRRWTGTTPHAFRCSQRAGR